MWNQNLKTASTGSIITPVKYFTFPLIVDAYGKIAIFSLVYVVGAQLALFNILSTFGVPFYHIYVEFGPGFVYDVVADSILIATYIGMNNEFFFAIPKKKVTVSYTLPGLSPSGPNIPGQIL